MCVRSQMSSAVFGSNTQADRRARPNSTHVYADMRQKCLLLEALLMFC